MPAAGIPIKKVVEALRLNHAASYRIVAPILKQRLDQQPLHDDQAARPQLPLHADVRGSGD